MPFNITFDKPKPYKNKQILFQSEDLKDCIAFCAAPPTNEDWQNWEIQINNDEGFKYRDVFEHWVNNVNLGVFRREAVQVFVGEGTAVLTPPLVANYISPIELDWDTGDPYHTFTVRFLVDPLPF